MLYSMDNNREQRHPFQLEQAILVYKCTGCSRVYTATFPFAIPENYRTVENIVRRKAYPAGKHCTVKNCPRYKPEK